MRILNLEPFTPLFLVLLAPVCLSGQSSDLGNWLIYFGNKKISPKWNWHHEVQEL